MVKIGKKQAKTLGNLRKHRQKLKKKKELAKNWEIKWGIWEKKNEKTTSQKMKEKNKLKWGGKQGKIVKKTKTGKKCRKIKQKQRNNLKKLKKIAEI